MSKSKVRPVESRFRLQLEELEAVVSPSSFNPPMGPTPPSQHDDTPPPPTPGTNQAPVIQATWSNATEGGITISGTVSDDQSVAGLTVIIQGNGVFAIANVQANGTFSVTFLRPTPEAFTLNLLVYDALGAKGTATINVPAQ